MALSSRLQTANIDEMDDDLDAPNLLDWELSNRSWFQDMADDMDQENLFVHNTPTEKITLAELYDAESDIDILFPTRSTWVLGLAQMEDEIEYYDSLNRPEIEEPLKVPASIAKKQKVDVVIDSD